MHVTHIGAFTSLDTSEGNVRGLTVDALLLYCGSIVGEKKSAVLRDCSISAGDVSRVRKGAPIPDIWILKLHEYTGIPISELRALSNTQPNITRHERTRYDQDRTGSRVLPVN